MTPRIKIDSAKIRKAMSDLRTSPAALRRTEESLMRQLTGQVAVELASATNPPFFNQQSAPIDGFKGRIKTELRIAAPDVQSLYLYVYSNKGHRLAKKFWAILQKGDPQAASRFLDDNGIAVNFSAFNPGAIKRGSKGRIDKNQNPQFLDETEAPKRDEYTKRKQGNVGLAKAGWLSAANGITRSRAGGSGVGWVRKLARKASGKGTLTNSSDGVTITLVNEVPHASDALNMRLMLGVTREVERRLARSIKQQLTAMAKKL